MSFQGESMLTTLASASGEAVEKEFPLSAAGFGLVGFGLLMLLLYVVTRLDPDR
jgi:hypothetical protein